MTPIFSKNTFLAPMPTPDEWFDDALRQYRAGTLPAYKILDLGRTPFHQFAGWLSRLPILMPQKMLGKAKEKHLLDLAGFAGLPSRLQKPAAIFASKDQPGRFVLVTDLLAEEGPVVVVIAPTQNRDAGTHWVVVSVHARDAAQLRRWQTEGLLRYCDPEKCQSWQQPP